MRTNPQAFNTIHEYFIWDQQRLEGLLEQIAGLVADGELRRAHKLFGHYERGVRRHLRIEESVLFQTIANERTGAARWAPTTIQSEHAEILKLVDEIGAALTREDAAGFGAAHDRLIATLPERRRRLEETVYPLVDALVGAVEAQRIVARLRAEPGAR